jgi:hypothetical protein
MGIFPLILVRCCVPRRHHRQEPSLHQLVEKVVGGDACGIVAAVAPAMEF